MKRLFTLLIITMTALNLSAQTTKIVVAYFSASGVTATAAKELAKEKNADLYSIEPAQKYTSADLDWRNKQSRSSLEMADPEERPTIKMCTDIRPYDTIYLGFPIWWGICPRIIQSWIDNNDLSGKRIIPFSTSGGSTIDGAVEFLRTTYPQYNWADGMLLNSYTKEDLKKLIK